MGHDPNLFVNNIDDDLICSICYGVLDNPVIDECNHIFCESCYSLWYKQSQTCPYSRRLLIRPPKKIPFEVKKRLDDLLVKCANYSKCKSSLKLKTKTNFCEKCKLEKSKAHLINYNYERESHHRFEDQQTLRTGHRVLIVFAVVFLVLVTLIRR